MKFTAVFTLLACALSVAAVPVEPGMDESFIQVVDHITTTVNKLKKRATEEFPRALGEPRYFVVTKAE